MYADDISGEFNSNIKLKANIVLISILIPIAIIALTVLIVSLWVWNRTFKQQKRQLQSRRKMIKMNNHVSKFQTDSESETVQNNNSNNISNSNKKCPYFCNPTLWNKRSNSFKPYMINTCAKNDNIRASLKSNSEQTTRMTGYDDFRKTPVTNMIQLTPTENICQVESNSHLNATLSSHFEENNWDYNFATRGLYFAQPWLKGENQSAVVENYAGSVVLKLDPCDKNDERDSPTINSNNIDNNSGYSDTDGYYA